MTRKVAYWVSTGLLATLSVFAAFTSYWVVRRRFKNLRTWDIHKTAILWLTP